MNDVFHIFICLLIVDLADYLSALVERRRAEQVQP